MITSRAALIGVAALLSACTADSLWPSFDLAVAPASRVDGARDGEYVAQPVSADISSVPSAASSALPSAVAIAPLPEFPATGTVVGGRVAQLRSELDRLEAAISDQTGRVGQYRAETEAASASYHVTVAAISARLQVGTTRGNPVLVSQLAQAQSALDRINGGIATISRLSSEVSTTQTSARFLADNTRAALGLSGAIDEDHRQLHLIQDQLARDQVVIDRMAAGLGEDLARQIAYVSAERANMAALSASVAEGELIETAAAGGFRPMAAPATPVASAVLDPAPVGDRKPLVVVRFDRPGVAYQRQLSDAISKALQRRPDARFDVVAVSPTTGDVAGAQTSAQGIVRTLNDLGLGPTRVSLSSSTNAQAAVNEVRVYIR